MKTKKQTLLFNIFVSMGVAAIIFIIVGVIIDRIFHGNIQMTNYAFSKMAIATVVIGLGFGLPATSLMLFKMLVSYPFLHRQLFTWGLVVLL